jgi:hypothetical protein
MPLYELVTSKGRSGYGQVDSLQRSGCAIGRPRRYFDEGCTLRVNAAGSPLSNQRFQEGIRESPGERDREERLHQRQRSDLDQDRPRSPVGPLAPLGGGAGKQAHRARAARSRSCSGSARA